MKRCFWCMRTECPHEWVVLERREFPQVGVKFHGYDSARIMNECLAHITILYACKKCGETRKETIR